MARSFGTGYQGGQRVFQAHSGIAHESCGAKLPELAGAHALSRNYLRARELSAIDSLVVWLIQLLPEEDESCCSVWASLVAAGGTVMAYVPSGVSTALRKYLFPICAKLSCACPV